MDGSALLIVVLIGVVVWFVLRNVQLGKSRSALAAEKAALQRRVEGAEHDQKATAERVRTAKHSACSDCRCAANR